MSKERGIQLVSGEESLRSRRLIAFIVLLAAIWIISPYLVRLAFGSDVANCVAGIGVGLWFVSVLSITNPKRSRLSPSALSPVYLCIAAAFTLCLAATAVYMWFFG